MACSINLFNYLGGTPDENGTWALLSGGPLDLSVNAGPITTYSNGNIIGVGFNTTIDVTDTAAGVYTFRYSVGTNPCDAQADVAVTVVDGAVAGVDAGTTVCDSNPTVFILFDLLCDDQNNCGVGGGAIDTNGTWSGGGIAAAGGNYQANTAVPTDDTFTANGLLPGNYVFDYTVNNTGPGTPNGCTNCVSTAKITFTVIAAGNAGTGGSVTLCNSPA